MTGGARTPEQDGDKKLLRDPNLWVIFAITLMAVAGIAPVAPSFPLVSQSLHVPQGRLGLVITVYTLPGTVLALFEGILADRFGRKKVLVPSLLLFAVAGALCASVHTFGGLLLFRGLQGIGASALPYLNATLIGDLYQGNQRTRAMGYNGSALSSGTAMYPLIGGGLALLGWRYPYLVPLFAIPVAAAVLIFLKNPEPARKQPLKSYLQSAWAGVQRQGIGWVYLAVIVLFLVYYGSYLTHFSFLLRHRFGSSSLTIGLFYTSSSVLMGAVDAQLSKLARRFHRHHLLTFSFLLFALGLAIVPWIAALGALWALLVPAAILGVAMGLSFPNAQDLIAGDASLEHRAGLMSLTGASLRAGETVGPVIMDAALGPWGTAGVFYLGAAIATLMFVVAMFTIAGRRQPGKGPTQSDRS